MFELTSQDRVDLPLSSGGSTGNLIKFFPTMFYRQMLVGFSVSGLSCVNRYPCVSCRCPPKVNVRIVGTGFCPPEFVGIVGTCCCPPRIFVGIIGTSYCPPKCCRDYWDLLFCVVIDDDHLPLRECVRVCVIPCLSITSPRFCRGVY